MGSGVNMNVNPVFELQRSPPKELLDRIRNELKKRGVNGIRSISRCFMRNDKNKSETLDREEFKWALKEAGFTLTKTEENNLFRYFDKNCDDQVSYKEFIRIIRGDMNEKRRNIVNQAFKKLDKDGSGVVNLLDLAGVYDPS